MRNLKANNIQIRVRLKMIAALVIQKRGNHRSIASLNHLNSKVCNLPISLTPLDVILPFCSGDVSEMR